MANVDVLSLRKQVDQMLPQLTRMRRHLHRHPETSGNEKETAAYVASVLKAEGVPVQCNIGGHGLLARIESPHSSEWIALRADMDGLPIHDRKSCDYASMVQDVSHACGHDVHTAMLTAAAVVLHKLRDQLPYSIACIFQPAEETTEGAAAMLADGVFEEISAKRIHALHVSPYLPAGSVGLKSGAICAAADMFTVEITGRGGHAARPHECIDVILVTSQIIAALHHIISRRINPLHPAVLTIGQIHGGSAANVIPDRVSFSGTVRTLNPEVHEEIRLRMDRIIRQTAETWGAVARFQMQQAIPVLYNDAKIMRMVRQRLAHYLPDVPLIDIEEPSMGGEDFAEFLKHIPGSLLRLGTGSGPATRYPLHHPCFDIDESAMASGVAALVSLCLGDEPPA